MIPTVPSDSAPLRPLACCSFIHFWLGTLLADACIEALPPFPSPCLSPSPPLLVPAGPHGYALVLCTGAEASRTRKQRRTTQAQGGCGADAPSEGADRSPSLLTRHWPVNRCIARHCPEYFVISMRCSPRTNTHPCTRTHTHTHTHTQTHTHTHTPPVVHDSRGDWCGPLARPPVYASHAIPLGALLRLDASGHDCSQSRTAAVSHGSVFDQTLPLARSRVDPHRIVGAL